MFNLVERRLATFTPRHAEEFLKEHNLYCDQRPLVQAHVDYLAGKLRDGLFVQTDVAFARLPDGRSAMVDGQHGLHACRQSGLPINVAVCGYEVRDAAEIWALYSEHDQGMRRTQADVIRAARNVMPPDVREIPSGKVSLYGAAILMAPSANWAGSYSSREVKPKRRVMAVCSAPAEALFLHDFQSAEIFNRIPVRMAMAATFRADPNRARAFWDGVADVKRPPADEPRRVLRRFLAESSTRGSSAVRVRAIYAYCVGCWNAHATGKPLDDCIHEAMQHNCKALKPVAPVPATAAILPPRIAEAPKPAVPAAPTATVANPRPVNAAPAAFPVLRAAPAAAGTSAHA